MENPEEDNEAFDANIKTILVTRLVARKVYSFYNFDS